MKIATVLLFSFAVSGTAAQHTITGKVTDRKQAPVPYANIYFEGSYDGTTSDTLGNYSLTSGLTGPQVLVTSSVGYERSAIPVVINWRDTAIHVILAEEVNQLNEVAITAGVFNASDRKKSATLTSFDIASTASAMGDIYGAYATMPGSQKVGEEGMLFVRGGEGYETKTYMDGMLVQSPYFSSMPDIPTRGRFSPLLFSETLFSTGGYSAEYGQALSSIVDLTTNGLESEDKTSISLMSVGGNASVSRRWENSSVAFTGMVASNALHHKLFKQNVDWIRDPLLGDGMVMYRKRVGETGLLKSFCSYNFNTMQMNYDNFEQGTMDEIEMKTHTLHSNTTYSGELGNKWLIRTGLGVSLDHENMHYETMPVLTDRSSLQLKIGFTHLTTEKLKIRMGGDVIGSRYMQKVQTDSLYIIELDDIKPSLFLEPELKISSKIALRVGLRTEYTSALDELVVSPRISAAFKTGANSQASLAYGKFRQNPENEILRFAPGLSSEGSDHYIVNFQYKKNRRIFRIETYLKRYTDLVKYQSEFHTDPATYNNDGSGNASGVDIFWRDRSTFEGSDYWISYSFLKTNRDYKDYSECVMPSYASAHNLSVVYKQFFTRLRTFAGITYSFASGRPYNDMNSSEFMAGRTKPYHDISLNVTYLTTLFKKECIIHLGITNLLGFDNVFGYRYSAAPGENGLFAEQAIVPTTGRQAVLLLLLSL